jgi:hypothetical protein
METFFRKKVSIVFYVAMGVLFLSIVGFSSHKSSFTLALYHQQTQNCGYLFYYIIITTDSTDLTTTKYDGMVSVMFHNIA